MTGPPGTRGPRIPRAPAALLTASALLLLPGTLALAGVWATPPSDLSAPGQNAYVPQIAPGPSGVVTAVWRRSNGTASIIQASRYAAGAWSAPSDLSAPGQDAYAPQIATDPSGVVTAVWYRSNGTDLII